MYTTVADLALPFCPEAPLVVLVNEARRAAIDFCRRSRFVVGTQEIALKAGVAAYRLRGRDQTRVDQVLRTQIGDDYLRQVNSVFGQDRTGEPRHFELRGDQIILDPVPEQDDRLLLQAVLVPKRDSDVLPESLIERWQDALVSGTVARACMVPSRPWTNPELAMYHKREFERAVLAARQAKESHGWNPQRIALRAWV